MTPETQENFQGLIPSKEMMERNKREMENLKGPPLPCREDRPDEDFDNPVEASRERFVSMMMLNTIAVKAAQMERNRSTSTQPRAA